MEARHGGFVQIIAFKTSRPQTIQELADEMEKRDDQAGSNMRPTPLCVASIRRLPSTLAS